MERSRRPTAEVALLTLALVAPVSLGAPQITSGTPAPSEAMKPALPKEKETVLGLYLTAKEAYAKWKAEPEKVKILDVRTTEEYLFVGHVHVAWNIPLFHQTYEWDAARQHFPMKPNPGFLAQVMKVAKPTDTILVMCRSGGRSAMAVNRLAAAGFRNVYNITDGMEGDVVHDPDSYFRGRHLKNGWKNSGEPWTYDIDPTRVFPKSGS